MRATPPSPYPVNSRPTPCRRSPNPANRNSMHRIILFLVLIALAAAGAAWVADQSGDVALSWGGWRVQTSLPVFALALGVTIVAMILMWTLIGALWRTPEKIRRRRRERRHARAARDRPRRFRRRPQPCRRRPPPRRGRSVGAAAARAIRPARRRPRRRANGVSRHGGTRGHKAARS